MITAATNIQTFVAKRDLIRLWVYPDEAECGDWDREAIWVRPLEGKDRHAVIKSVPWQSCSLAPEDEVVFDHQMVFERTKKHGGYSVLRADFIGMGIQDVDADFMRTTILQLGVSAFDFAKHQDMVVGVAFAVPAEREAEAEAILEGDLLVESWRWGKRHSKVQESRARC